MQPVSRALCTDINMKKINKELISPTDEPTSEKTHRLVRTALSAIPAAGGAASEAFSAIIEAPMSRRQRKWMEDVTDVVNQLTSENVITYEHLESNDIFFTALAHASAVAIKNHDSEKLEALKNALKNSVTPEAPKETIQLMYLNLIDSYTTWHIKIIKLFQNPTKWATDNNVKFPKWNTGVLPTVIEHAYPDLKNQRHIYNIVWEELYRNGLVSTARLGTTMSASGMLEKRTTDIGDEFVAFISK